MEEAIRGKNMQLQYRVINKNTVPMSLHREAEMMEFV